MAIQNRRGVYTDFDPTKLLPGEYAIVQSGDPDTANGFAIYMCFTTGNVKRVATVEELQEILANYTIDWENINDKPSTYPAEWTEIQNRPMLGPGDGLNSVQQQHAEASGLRSFATGGGMAQGAMSFATGANTTASGLYAHSEGNDTVASGGSAHAEGDTTTASKSAGHSEGYHTTASGFYSHSEGSYTTASGGGAHAEGGTTEASGPGAHSEGYHTTASGNYSHAEGSFTVANKTNQHVFGRYNIEDPATGATGTYVEIVGNGTASSRRSNARTLDWNGNEVIQGNMNVQGGTLTLGSEALTQKDLSSIAKAVDTNETEADLYICDAQGNVIGEFINGHIATKNFDSSTLSTKFNEKINKHQDVSDAGKSLVINDNGIVTPADVTVTVDETLSHEGEAADAKAVGDAIDDLEKQMSFDSIPKIGDAKDSTADLDVVDYYGNVIVRFEGGHIKTKEFDSSDVAYSSLRGKKWTCVGDSLTEANVRTTMHYHDYIAELTGIVVANHGHSGAGYYARSFDYAFMNEVKRIPTDSDVITIFGSVNDIYNASPIPLGTVTDTDTSTLCGCINIALDNLYARIPVPYLGIITPTPCWLQASGSVYDWTPSNPGNDLELYSEALAEICKRRSIPCLDLYHLSNLRPQVASFRTLAYSKDSGNGIHPNETGHKVIAARFMEFIKTLILS